MKCRTVLSGFLCAEGVIQFGYLIGINLVKSKYFPCCPEKTKPGKLSKYQIENKDKHYKPTGKLILNQNDKKNYVIEGKMLDWYLDHGMILKKRQRLLQEYIKN